jgi:hypothetical protein
MTSASKRLAALCLVCDATEEERSSAIDAPSGCRLAFGETSVHPAESGFLLNVPSATDTEADTEESDCFGLGAEDDVIVVGLEDVELVDDIARRIHRSEHRYRTTRVAPRRDRARRSSAPPRPANDVAALKPLVTDPDPTGTTRIALSMAALLLIVVIAMLLNPAL